MTDCKNIHEYIDAFIKGEGIQREYYQWLKNNGKCWEPTPEELFNDDAVKLAKKTDAQVKACYRNARVSLRHDKSLHYYEGIAQFMIPIEHAWTVKDGRIVDPTAVCLRDIGHDVPFSEYFGVEIPRLSRRYLETTSSNQLNGITWKK